jgi:hypothetical protein
LAIAQSFIAAATASAMAGSSLAPASIVLMTDLYTVFGSRAFIAALPNTFDAKISSTGVAEKSSGGSVGL